MSTPPHPRWCIPEHCQPDLHAGRPHTIPAADPLQPTVTAQLVQAAVVAAEPRIVITADDDGTVALTSTQARALGYVLVRIARLTGGAR